MPILTIKLTLTAMSQAPDIMVAIREYMRRYHVTQAELCERTGISQPAMSAALSDRRCPKTTTINRILAGLDAKIKIVPDLDKQLGSATRIAALAGINSICSQGCP